MGFIPKILTGKIFCSSTNIFTEKQEEDAELIIRLAGRL
jgi:hypothetical protein